MAMVRSPRGPSGRPPGPLRPVVWLLLALGGVLGLVASFALALIPLAQWIGPGWVAGGLCYGAAVLSLVVITARASAPAPLMWLLRLGLPALGLLPLMALAYALGLL